MKLVTMADQCVLKRATEAALSSPQVGLVPHDYWIAVPAGRRRFSNAKRLLQHYPIESRLVSMIGMSHFPTGGSIASLTRFSIFLLSSLGPLCPLLSIS